MAKPATNVYLATAQNSKANDTSGQSVLEIVGGIGEGAFVGGRVTSTGGFAICVFYIGDTTVTITVATGGNAGPSPITQVTAIAATAAAHLGK